MTAQPFLENHQQWSPYDFRRPVVPLVNGPQGQNNREGGDPVHAHVRELLFSSRLGFPLIASTHCCLPPPSEALEDESTTISWWQPLMYCRAAIVSPPSSSFC
uniref:Uncharacterized protein n=1 Tax=Micrurus lemniscatus lemniscatus TaxID=129467 RepID=A0A2D4HQY0_MICLE